MKKHTLLCICFAALVGYSCAEKPGIDVADMDRTADPAQDFYKFANGGWLERTPIPASESRWGIVGELRDRNKEALRDLLTNLASSDHEAGSNDQKVGDFYRTGMDSTQIEEDGTTPIQPYFEEIDAIRSFADILRVVASHQKFGTGALFEVLVEADFKNSDMTTVYMFQGGLGLPDRDYYLDEGERFVNYRSEYFKHLQKMFELLGEDPAKAEAAAQAIMGIETRLAKASWTRVQMRNLPAMYNKRTIAQANRETPNIDWQQHFSRLGVDDLDFFFMAQPKFLQEASTMLTAVSIDDWKIYLRWHLINAMSPYLSPDFVNQNFAFFQTVLRGTKELKPRWKRVTETTDGAIGEALGQLYVEKHFPAEAKAKANQMVTDLREAYRRRIENLDWMSEETKKNAFAKLENMVQKIGYPDKWRDYSSLEIKRDAYVLNVIRANEFEFDRNMKKIGKPYKSEWHMSPPTVNAYFHPLNNEIVFPAGILQPPFFDASADLAVNYGATGATIGHEITHGFDDQGSQFDADGNMSNWWTPEDKQQFEAKSKVVEQQFDEYTVLDSVKVNGKLTLGENIADLGGLAVAYDALQIALEKNGRPAPIDGFTQEQRFFISYATSCRGKIREDALLNQVKTDPHSPANYRAIGPISNMPQFFEAFEVKAGDAMRRPDSTLAKIW